MIDFAGLALVLELGAQIVDVDHASKAISNRSILTPARWAHRLIGRRPYL